MRAQQFTDTIAVHAEGPLWDDRGERLLFVDMLAGDVIELDGDGAATRHHLGTVAAAIRARTAGGFIVALEHEFALTDDAFRIEQTLPPVVMDAAIRMNDGGCDPQGRFYCGTMAYAETAGAGTLFRLDADLSTRVQLRPVTISNGLQWSADGARAYYNDTPTGGVDVFDFDGASGAFSDRRRLITIDPADGYPDGLAIDADDGLWVALWGGSAVRHYDSAGTLLDVVELPVRQVTACAFGGADRSTLFITTSRLKLEAGDEPQAGSMFRVDAGVRGAPMHRFAG